MRGPLSLVLAVFVCSSVATADIVLQSGSVEAWTEVLYPEDGQIFWVPNEYATVTVTAMGYSTIGYFARATLDTDELPFTGDATGGTLTHYVEMDFDGEIVFDYAYETVPDGDSCEPGSCDDWQPPDWLWYENAFDIDLLQITRTCGVGSHSIVLSHEVYDDRTEIHAFDMDWNVFYVFPVPTPLTIGSGTLLLAAIAMRRRRRVTLRMVSV